MLAWKPNVIIAGEGHKIKSHSTNASKALAKIGAVASYRLLLTGTLVTNYAEDVFTVDEDAVFHKSGIFFRQELESIFNEIGW